MLNHLCQPWVNHLRPLQSYKWPGLFRTGMGLQGSTVVWLLFLCWNISWKPWVNHLRPHQGYNSWVVGTPKISKRYNSQFQRVFFEISLHLGVWNYEFRFWILVLQGWILDGRWFSEEHRSMIVWQMSLCWITCASPGLTILDPFKATSGQGCLEPVWGFRGLQWYDCCFFVEIFLENPGLTILDPTKATTGHGW